jgi:hypothetical protein
VSHSSRALEAAFQLGVQPDEPVAGGAPALEDPVHPCLPVLVPRLDDRDDQAGLSPNSAYRVGGVMLAWSSSTLTG